jgi:hypothetical protein
MKGDAMSTQAKGTFHVETWDEKPYQEIGGGVKLTRASVAQTFAGDVEGKGSVEYLMAYREDGTATFVGLQRIEGKVGGRSGSFVLQLAGTFEGGVAKAGWFVVTGAGTGDLRSLRGGGGFEAPHGPDGTVTLDYDFG